MALRTIISGSSAIPQSNVLQLVTDLVSQSGVFNPAAGGFLVTPNAALTVNVAAGRAYLIASGGDCYPIINTAAITTTVNANSSGNPRITSIVLYQNPGGSPAADGSGTTFVVAVDGTPAALPTPPSSATIQSTVGGSNPFIVLCNVTVPSGATNLAVQGTLADVRPQVGFSANANGWIIPSDTFVWVSATSFKITGVDRTATYTKGTRIQLTNNTLTYFGAVASSSFSTDTTVNLLPNNDFTLVNSAITNPSYSYLQNPQGYPTWFNYTPVCAGFGAMTYTGITINVARFKSDGNSITLVLSANGTTGGTLTNQLVVSLPVGAIDGLESGACGTSDGGNPISGTYSISSLTNLLISKYDFSLYASGSGRNIRVDGMIYKI